jgi:hypothetical protein
VLKSPRQPSFWNSKRRRTKSHSHEGLAFTRLKRRVPNFPSYAQQLGGNRRK